MINLCKRFLIGLITFHSLHPQPEDKTPGTLTLWGINNSPHVSDTGNYKFLVDWYKYGMLIVNKYSVHLINVYGECLYWHLKPRGLLSIHTVQRILCKQ